MVVVHVIAAVEHVVGAALTAAINRGARLGRESRKLLTGETTKLKSVNSPRGQKNQLGWIAAIDWKFDDGRLLDDLSDGAVGRINGFCTASHFDGLGHFADGERKIDRRLLIRGDLYTGTSL